MSSSRLARNAHSRHHNLGKSQQATKRHHQRLRDIDKADFAFKADIEETTNFMIRPSGGRSTVRAKTSTAGKAKQQHQTKRQQESTTTLLGQVRKYGHEFELKEPKQYVRTSEGVTDDVMNYLPRKTEEFKHLSHIYPEAHRHAQEASKKKRGRRREEPPKPDVQLIDKSSPTERDQVQKPSLFQSGPKSATHRAGSMKKATQMLLQSNDPIREELSDHVLPRDSRNQNQQSSVVNMAASMTELMMPNSTQTVDIVNFNDMHNGNRRNQPRHSIGTRSDSQEVDITKQLRERAGSAGYLLNEDSEGAFDNHHQIISSERSAKIQSSGEKPQRRRGSSSGDKQMLSSLRETQATMANLRSRQTFSGNQQRILKSTGRVSKDTQQVHKKKSDEMQRILDQVHQENNRLWRLYDNQLESGKTRGSPKRSSYRTVDPKRASHDNRHHHRTADGRKEKAEDNKLITCESDVNQKMEFVKAVKNHTIYRRDRFIRNLSNQIKRNFDPYLRFQIPEKKDPFQERPLSSVIKRAGALYPSRDAMVQMGGTDKIVTNKSQTFKPGKIRPMSSNINQLLLLKDPSKKAFSNEQLVNLGQSGILGRNKLDVLSAQLGSKTTAVSASRGEAASLVQNTDGQRHTQTMTSQIGFTNTTKGGMANTTTGFTTTQKLATTPMYCETNNQNSQASLEEAQKVEAMKAAFETSDKWTKNFQRIRVSHRSSRQNLSRKQSEQVSRERDGQLVKEMLAKYHRQDKRRHMAEMRVFDMLQDKMHKLCDNEEQFQNGITTKIVKPALANDNQVERQESRHKRPRRLDTQSRLSYEKMQTSVSPMRKNTGSNLTNRPQTRQGSKEKKRDGDVNKLLHKVRKVEEEQMNADLQSNEEEGLDNIFKQLVALKTTYISESTVDPIESSYVQLIEGLGVFHERYNVRTFIDQYLEMLEDIKLSEEIATKVEAAGGKHKVDSDLVEKMLSKNELEIRLLNKFPCFDEQVDRARTFIMSILERKQRHEISPMKKVFEDLAYYAEDRKRERTMEGDRFKVEQKFVKIIRKFVEVQQGLAQKIKHATSPKEVKTMKDEYALNEQYIILCEELKELAGRNDETVLIKTLDISKAQHMARSQLEDHVKSPLNENQTSEAKIPPEREKEFMDLLAKGWEKMRYRELTIDEKLKVAQSVSDLCDRLMAKARARVQAEIEERNKIYLSFKARLELEREQARIAFQKRVDEERSRVKKEKVRNAIFKKFHIKERLKEAIEDPRQIQLDTIHAKLNLDACEIESLLPKSHTEPANLWEETQALRVIWQKIAIINETVMQPEVLFEKDELKYKPLLEKWHNQGQLLQTQKTGKSLQTGPSQLKNDLKEEQKEVPKERRHWKVRPKIGHEVTDDQVNLIEESLSHWSEISQAQRINLDSLLTKNNRFFSMFDTTTRFNMYEFCQVHRHIGKDMEIERDVEETENIHIMLRGNIHIVQVNDELDIQLRLASLRAGETCGDQAIQRKISDPLKVLSKERKTAVTNTEETITITIKRAQFMEALFKEMQQELFYKITLLKNTPFFQELSPYSLTIMASNVEVREVKYGEIVVQQGDMPDSLYILAYGECKTLYNYLEEKSTKVSKYANKCLKSDLPEPIHTGMVNYKQVPHEALVKYKKGANPSAVEEGAMAKTGGLKKSESTVVEVSNGSELDPQELNAKVQNTLRNNQGLEKKLSKVPTFPLRQFYHSVTNHNKKMMTIQFQNHIVYQKLQVGQAFGMRALLDPLICKRHIIENKTAFSDKLGINLAKLWEELVQQNQLSLEKAALRRARRKEANKQANRFCKRCFEKRNIHCTCKLDKLGPKEAALANKEREQNADREESSFCPEFNDSHEFDISSQGMDDDDSSDRPIVGDDYKLVSSSSKINQDLSEFTQKELTPDKAYEAKRDQIKNQIDKLMKPPKKKETKTAVATKKTQHKDRLQKRVEDQFSNKLYSQLMKAQVSIAVTSATAKFLVIKKEDKGLLNEYLRVCIDRAILETNFADLDRPESSHHDVQQAVHMSRGWTTFKEQFMSDLLKETKMQKKANKLLDD